MAKEKDWKENYDKANKSGGILKHTDKGRTPGMMYISTPKEIAGIIKKVPEGKLITTKIIADKLSKKHKADFICPLTTGIFTSVVVNYVEQEKANGKDLGIPWWRVVKPKGELYEHYLRQFHPQREILEAEGFDIEEGKGKQPPKVIGYEKYLV